MKKKLLMVAVGAALAAGAVAANAAPTVYGRLHVSIDSFDNGADDLTVNRADGINVSSNSSRVGVKGAEDVGGGLKAVYQAEFGFAADEDGGANSQRNSFAGLSGGFGTLIAGRHDTPYKLATGKLDPFSETVGDYNGIIASANGNPAVFDLRVNNAIAYISPNFSGFSFAAAYTVGPVSGVCGGTGGAQANGADCQDVTAISAMGVYDQGPLFVSLAYESHDIDEDVGADLSRKATKVGAGYDFGVAKVGLVYETMSHDNDDSAMNRNAIWATGTFPFGNNAVSVAFGKADESDAPAGDDDATLTAVGFFHNFSKTAKAYIVYANMDNNDLATYRPGNSGHGDLVSSVAGEANSAISVGMYVDF
jgi:predicted porin